jgi:dynein heavy chain 1
MSGVVCVKRGTVVEAEKSLNTQLRMITLSEGSPYETLHDYIASGHDIITPFFSSMSLHKMS